MANEVYLHIPNILKVLFSLYVRIFRHKVFEIYSYSHVSKCGEHYEKYMIDIIESLESLKSNKCFESIYFLCNKMMR